MSILSNILMVDVIPGDTVAQMIDTMAQAVAAEQELSVWDLCLKGGFIMIPLAILSVISVYIFVERYLAISAAAKEDGAFMANIKAYIHDGDIQGAMNLCSRTDTPYSRLVAKGISRIGRPMNDVLVAIENVGNMEVSALAKGFTWLATTSSGAPMIGFLGTVTGMVKAFFALASAGGGANVSVLAGGIYEALVTTVAGLVVGVIALFAYNYLVSLLNKVMKKLEARTMEFMDLLNEPAK